MTNTQSSKNKPRRLEHRMGRVHIAGAAMAIALGVIGYATASHTPCIHSGSSGAIDATTGSLLSVPLGASGVSKGKGVVLGVGPVYCMIAKQAPAATGNCDFNRTIDLFDYSCLFDCLDGPDQAYGPGCENFDFDHDGNVDEHDVAIFVTLFD